MARASATVASRIRMVGLLLFQWIAQGERLGDLLLQPLEETDAIAGEAIVAEALVVEYSALVVGDGEDLAVEVANLLQTSIDTGEREDVALVQRARCLWRQPLPAHDAPARSRVAQQPVLRHRGGVLFQRLTLRL